MPNIKSAKKRVDVNEKNRAINRANKSELATGLKKYNAAISAGDVNQAKSLLPLTVSLIDESVTRGVIHKNKADRKKAEVNAKLFKLESSLKTAKKPAKKVVEAQPEEKKEEVQVEEAPKAKKTTTRTKKTEVKEEGEKKTTARKTTTKTTSAKTTATKKTAKTAKVSE